MNARLAVASCVTLAALGCQDSFYAPCPDSGHIHIFQHSRPIITWTPTCPISELKIFASPPTPIGELLWAVTGGRSGAPKQVIMPPVTYGIVPDNAFLSGGTQTPRDLAIGSDTSYMVVLSTNGVPWADTTFNQPGTLPSGPELVRRH